jgi:hypothetical protein
MSDAREIQIMEQSLGRYGSKRITDTNATTPDTGYKFIAVEITEDAVFSSLVGNMANSSGLTLPTGVIVYGLFTSITLTSGKVIAYQGV